jgi:hypothetical protein
VDLKVDDEEDDEDIRVSRAVCNLSMCVCWVDLCVNVVDLHIMREHLNYWELWKTITFHQILQSGSWKGAMVLCKTCEIINGELKCVVLCFLCIVNLRGGVMNTGLCNLFGLKGLYYKV